MEPSQEGAQLKGLQSLQMKAQQQMHKMMQGQQQTMRKYRKGDFPDIEIQVQDLVEPLLEVALHQESIGKEIFQ